MGSLTADCPKPLLEVGGQPFLAHLLRYARRFGMDDFVLLAGHFSGRVSAFAAGGIADELKCRIHVVVEPSPAGTGGALRFARELLQPAFLMTNGDSLFDFNWLDLAAHPFEAGLIGWLGLRQIPDASRFGVVEIEGAKIGAFQERPKRDGPGIVNGGVYWLSRAIVDEIGSFPCSLERDVFPAMAAAGRLGGVVYDGYFIDIGVPEDYLRSQGELLSAVGVSATTARNS